MRIRFTMSIASATWNYDADEEASFPDEQAMNFIAGGQAVAIESVAPIETTTAERAAPSSGPLAKKKGP